MFKNGHYIDSGLPQEVRNKNEEQVVEENKKYKCWDEVPTATEDQDDGLLLIE